MFTYLISGASIPVLTEVIRFAQARHELLAGNIANLDTPGYQAKDLSVDSFRQHLREAIEARRERNEPIPPGLYKAGESGPPGPAAASHYDVLYHDQSNVNLERQVAELSNNLFMHNMAITMMTSQFHLLQAAISERV